MKVQKSQMVVSTGALGFRALQHRSTPIMPTGAGFGVAYLGTSFALNRASRLFTPFTIFPTPGQLQALCIAHHPSARVVRAQGRIYCSRTSQRTYGKAVCF